MECLGVMNKGGWIVGLVFFLNPGLAYGESALDAYASPVSDCAAHGGYEEGYYTEVVETVKPPPSPEVVESGEVVVVPRAVPGCAECEEGEICEDDKCVAQDIGHDCSPDNEEGHLICPDGAWCEAGICVNAPGDAANSGGTSAGTEGNSSGGCSSMGGTGAGFSGIVGLILALALCGFRRRVASFER